MYEGFKSTWNYNHPHTQRGIGTLETTPKGSMCDSSSLSFLRSGSGTFLGMCRAKGVASRLRQVLKSEDGLQACD